MGHVLSTGVALCSGLRGDGGRLVPERLRTVMAAVADAPGTPTRRDISHFGG